MTVKLCAHTITRGFGTWICKKINSNETCRYLYILYISVTFILCITGLNHFRMCCDVSWHEAELHISIAECFQVFYRLLPNCYLLKNDVTLHLFIGTFNVVEHLQNYLSAITLIWLSLASCFLFLNKQLYLWPKIFLVFIWSIFHCYYRKHKM